MALFVVLKSRSIEALFTESKGIKAGEPNSIERHVPFVDMPKLINEEIDYIQADGDELEHILTTFSGLPACSNTRRVVKWFGDTAKFIYFNL